MNTFFTCEQKFGNTIFTFSPKAKVLSTSPLNGGLTRHLSHAVNINCMNGSYECKMLGDTYEKDLAAHVHALGLSPSCTTALSTAAWTELRAIEEVCFRDLCHQNVPYQQLPGYPSTFPGSKRYVPPAG